MCSTKKENLSYVQRWCQNTHEDFSNGELEEVDCNIEFSDKVIESQGFVGKYAIPACLLVHARTRIEIEEVVLPEEWDIRHHSI